MFFSLSNSSSDSSPPPRSLLRRRCMVLSSGSPRVFVTKFHRPHLPPVWDFPTRFCEPGRTNRSRRRLPRSCLPSPSPSLNFLILHLWPPECFSRPTHLAFSASQHPTALRNLGLLFHCLGPSICSLLEVELRMRIGFLPSFKPT